MVYIRRLRGAGVCQIWGRTTEDGRGEIFRDLAALAPATKKGVIELFNRVERDGLVGLPDALSHSVDERNRIYEFIKGDTRVLYFKDGGTVVICAECVHKSGQKVNKVALARAIKFKGDYTEAKKNGQLVAMEVPRPLQ